MKHKKSYLMVGLMLIVTVLVFTSLSLLWEQKNVTVQQQHAVVVTTALAVITANEMYSTVKQKGKTTGGVFTNENYYRIRPEKNIRPHPKMMRSGYT